MPETLVQTRPAETQLTRELTYMEALREALAQAMEADERVFLIGEDVGVYGGAFGVSHGLIERFGPERVRDTPISEAAIAGACLGAALAGMRPVGEIQFMDFVTLSMEQLVLQAAKVRFMFGGKATVPLLRMPGGAGTGAAAQHSESLENWFVHVPGLKVVMPSNPYDAKGLLLSAIEDDNPVIFVEHKLLYKVKGPVPEEMYRVPLGRSAVVREGNDLTVVATGLMVQRALEAAETLSREDGIELAIVDPRTLNPLDDEPIIASVARTGRLLVVHEAVGTGGYGGEIVARVAASEAFDYLDAPIRRLAGRDVPIPYNRELERAAIPQVEEIIAEARALAQGRV